MSDLLSCPFCGGREMVVENLICEGFIRCKSCPAQMAVDHGYHGDAGYKQVKAAWNTRTKADPDPLMAQLVGFVQKYREQVEDDASDFKAIFGDSEALNVQLQEIDAALSAYNERVKG